MLGWNPKEVIFWVAVALSFGKVEAGGDSSIYLNSSTAASDLQSLQSLQSTTSAVILALATSSITPTTPETSNHVTPTTSTATCSITLNPLDLLAPSYRTLLSISPLLVAAAFTSEYNKVASMQANFARIAASPQNLPSTALSSYLSSLYSTLKHDITSFFGPNGIAILDFNGLPDCQYTQCFSQYIAQSATFVSLNPGQVFYYTAKPPCCQQCTVYGQNVQLSYWQTPPPSPPTSILVDQTNHTYLSPSVYGVFTSLYASDLCGPVGSSFPLKTLTFEPSELSSSQYVANPYGIPVPPGQWTAINFADFGPNCICSTNCSYDPILKTTLTNRCTPQLSLPAKVTALDPLWAKCAADLGGVFDPPLALNTADGLTLPKTTPVPNPPVPPTTSTTATAEPVNTATSPIPPPTTTAAPPQPQPPPVANSVAEPPSRSTSTVNAGNNPAQTTVEGAAVVPTQSTSSDTANRATESNGAPQVHTLAESPPPDLSNPPASSTPPTTIIAQPITTTPPQILTLNDQTLTANSQSNFVIGTQTLIPGSLAITVSGTVYSLALGGTQVVVGTSTQSIGGAIISILNGGSSSVVTTTTGGKGGGSTTQSGVAQYTGGAGSERTAGERQWKVLGWVGVVAGLMVWF